MFILFLFLSSHVIYHWISKKKDMHYWVWLITVSGSYLAISFGCGNSGGLSEGEAAIGIGLMIGLLLSNMKFDFSWICKGIVTIFCLLITLQSAEKKMATTYYWWGIDEANYWESTEKTTIPLLQGLKLSKETKAAYETIYNVVRQNVEPSESIYCFPHIPIFYVMCDRKDPGVKAKVQWFDVSSDTSLEHDIEILKKNPPKAILIYDTAEYAYTQHELGFRNGGISGTSKMKNFLFDFVDKEGYTLYDNISSTPNNTIFLYYKEDTSASASKAFSGGERNLERTISDF